VVRNRRLQQLAHRITVAAEGAEEAVDLKAGDDVEHAADRHGRIRKADRR
jgi:hypothetical protein